MKKFGYILLFFAASFSAYLIWSYFDVSSSDKTAVTAGKSENYKISQSGKSTSSIQADILSSGEKQIETIKSFVSQIPQAANNAFNSLIDQTKNTAREKLINILETTSSPSTAPVSQPIPANSVIGSGTAQNSSSEPRVCFVVSQGESIEYGISQPFSGTAETSYKVDWGDGESASGIFHVGDQNITVSHSYSQQGIYPVIFQLTGSSTTLMASRSVCVK